MFDFALSMPVLASKHPNREAWLNELAQMMSPWFDQIGSPLPENIRVSVGFTSVGLRGKAVGQIWYPSVSQDAHHEIFIRPDMREGWECGLSAQDMVVCESMLGKENADRLALAIEYAAILAHELVHAAVGHQAGHGPAFKKVATAIGLTGKMRSTKVGPDFLARFGGLYTDIGPLPHARMTPAISSGPKKQTQRHVKCECMACGYLVRTARKWLEEVGAPHCPAHGEMTVTEAAEAPEEVAEEA